MAEDPYPSTMGTEPDEEPPEPEEEPSEEGSRTKMEGEVLEAFERSFKRHEEALRRLAEL